MTTGNVRLEEIAQIFEANTDDDNQWDACEITERIADILVDDGYFTRCGPHGVYPTSLGTCPRCDTDDDDECEDHEIGEHTCINCGEPAGLGSMTNEQLWAHNQSITSTGGSDG